MQLGYLPNDLTQIEFDAENMKVTKHEGMENYIKEPVREGWSFGEEVW